MWRRLYTLIIIVFIPLVIFCINNIIIFRYVRSSTNRVKPSSAIVQTNQHQPITRRDLHLLRHMIIMFCIFVGGWAPVYIYAIISLQLDSNLMAASFTVLSQLSLFLNITNLFLYNHELRRYFREKIFRRPQK
jgi:hypothetical protein